MEVRILLDSNAYSGLHGALRWRPGADLVSADTHFEYVRRDCLGASAHGLRLEQQLVNRSGN